MDIKQMSPQLLVSDLEHSIGFYKDVLGFSVDFRYEDFYAGITNGTHSIHLKLGVPRNTNAADDLDLYFTVQDIDACYEEAEYKQANISQPLRQMPYGREFYLTDPDGYRLGFIEL